MNTYLPVGPLFCAKYSIREYPSMQDICREHVTFCATLFVCLQAPKYPLARSRLVGTDLAAGGLSGMVGISMFRIIHGVSD